MKNLGEQPTVRFGKLYSKLTGQNHLIHVENYTPQKTSHKQHGSLFFIIDINHPSKDSQKIISAIVDTAIHHFYKNLDDTLNSMEVALRYTNEKLAELAEEGNTSWINNLNAIVAVISGHDIHLTQCGSAEAFLIRNKIISHISEGLSEKVDEKHPLNTFVNISSGKMNMGDRVIIATEQLFNNLSLDRIRRLSIQHSPTTCVAEIARILAQDNIRSIGAIVFEATTEEKLAKEVIHPQPEEVVLQDKKYSGTKFSELITQLKDIGQSIISTTKKYLPKKSKSSPQKNMIIKENKRSPKTPPENSNTRKTEPKSAIIKNSINKQDTILNKLNNKNPNRYLLLIPIIIIMIVILGVSITYLLGKQNTTNKQNAVNEVIQQAEALSNQGESALIIGDLSDAKGKYGQALEKLLTIKSSPFYTEKINDLTDKIKNKLDSADKIYRIDTAKPLADLNTLGTPGNSFTQLYKIKDNLFSFSKSLAGINQTNGKITNITGFDIANFIGAAILDEATDNPNIAFYHNGQMQKYNPASNTLQDLSNLDTAWKPAISIASYYNNLYFLSPMENQIYKYTSLGGNDYSSADKYLADAAGINLSNAASITIDGSVYVLTKEGKVYKFTKGEGSEYVLKNIPEQYSKLSNPNIIYTEENLDYIYISDPGNKRIVEFKKETGEYSKQFVNEKLGNIDGFIVNNKIKTIYLLSDNKIYTISI